MSEILEKSQLPPTKFTTHSTIVNVNETNYSFRILKMKDSYFFYIGSKESEIFDELAMAMNTNKNNNSTEVISTMISGPLIGFGSQVLAEKLSKKLKKQVYVSCNVQNDRLIRPLIEKRLNEEIKLNKEFFDIL